MEATVAEEAPFFDPSVHGGVVKYLSSTSEAAR